MDRALRNCFTGSSILGLIVLIMVFVVPTPPLDPVTVAQMPERFARLILERPQPVASPIKAPEQVTLEAPKVETPPEQTAKPKPPPRRRLDKPKVTSNSGSKGRQKAQKEVTQNLAQVTGSLDKVMDNLSKSLPVSEKSKNGDKSKPRRGRRPTVRSGRTSDQVTSVGGVSNLSSADVSTSAIESDGISIAAITDLTVQEGGQGTVSGGGSGSGSSAQGGRGQYRSNESLLNVVRRYAPGIQYCYDNELKKNPGLRGKLAINLTVLANGKVSDVFVVEDTMGSPAVTNCVLSQIHGWQFPSIPQGTTSFKTPFVFTPPG
jgi:outer membrane biosynthesis protein TonB